VACANDVLLETRKNNASSPTENERIH